MSNTTTVSPAIYYQILQALQQGGHEVAMSMTIAPDGTQTQAIVIQPVAPVVVVPEKVEAPKPKPKPKPLTYCPECEPRPGFVSTGTCTPSRQRLTGNVVARRCKKHMHCRDCGKKLPPEKRFVCLGCQSLNNLVW